MVNYMTDQIESEEDEEHMEEREQNETKDRQ